jgi:hypothetical protein
MSSADHRALRISPWVTFGYSQKVLKGARFAAVEDVKSNATAERRKMPKEAFYWCFQQWRDRQSKRVRAQGSYFEGDWLGVAVPHNVTVQYHISGNFFTAHRI